ncbi:hypothetical protein ACFO8Q_20745 [Effusibacillus consociatus]|uniref:Uncharacterized protein n=1 Tax=Effusibacillus consociatus TaxID=1117041 RepID=A0ABV9Q6A0_9BACL
MRPGFLSYDGISLFAMASWECIGLLFQKDNRREVRIQTEKEPKMEKQEKQYVHNPITGEMMEANTFSGKEFFWRQGSPDEKNNENAPSGVEKGGTLFEKN